jgi:hypothetical protein
LEACCVEGLFSDFREFKSFSKKKKKKNDPASKTLASLLSFKTRL